MIACVAAESKGDLCLRMREEVRKCEVFNLVPRAHVPFGQHQDTECTPCLGADQKARGLWERD